MSWCGIYTKFWQEGLFPHMPFKQLISGSDAAACKFLSPQSPGGKSKCKYFCSGNRNRVVAAHGEPVSVGACT